MPVDISDIRSPRGVPGRLAPTADDQTSSPARTSRARRCATSRTRISWPATPRGHPNQGDQINRYYQGTQYIDRLETMAREELLALARCRQADVRPISGNAANTAIALGYLRAGDPIIVNSTPRRTATSATTPSASSAGASRGAASSLNLGSDNAIPLHYLPLSEDHYHVDVPKSLDLIERTAPRLVVLGKSLFLFPEPVRELAAVCREKGIPILYDGAHVLGLILGGQFQDPWREGATWVTASTHKTFPGPQRGVILADLDEADEKRYWPAANRGVFPGSSSNHHLHSLPGLLVAIREMKLHGQAYAAPGRRPTRRPSGAPWTTPALP